MSKVASEEKAQFNAARISSIRGVALARNLFVGEVSVPVSDFRKSKQYLACRSSNLVQPHRFRCSFLLAYARVVSSKRYAHSDPPAAVALTRDFDTSSSTTSSASSG